MIIGKIVYILVVLLIFGFSILYIDNLAVAMLCACLMLPIFLAAILLIGSYKMKFIPNALGESFYRQDEIIYRIGIEKFFSLPIGYKFVLCVENKYTNETQFRKIKGIAFGKKQEITVKIKSEHCGHLKIYIKKAKAFDYLKIFGKSVNNGEICDVIVLPNIIEIEGTMVTMPTFDDEGNQYSKTKSGDDPSEIFNIRQFKDGDDPRRIHWNLSGRTDDYFVKEYGQPLMNSIVILIDNQISSTSMQDVLFDLVVSLSNFLLKNGVEHIVCKQDDDLSLNLSSITDEEELFETADGLLSMPLAKNPEKSILDDFLNSEYNRHSHLIFVTANESSVNNPLLRQQSIPVTAMVITDKIKENFQTEDNFRCFYINNDIQASLSGLEL